MNEKLLYVYIYIRENWDVINDRIKNFNTWSFIKATRLRVVLELEIEIER